MIQKSTRLVYYLVEAEFCDFRQILEGYYGLNKRLGCGSSSSMNSNPNTFEKRESIWLITSTVSTYG